MFGEGVNPRLRKIRDALAELGLPQDELLEHGTPRLVYGVQLAVNTREYLLGRTKRVQYLLPQRSPREVTNGIARWWIERWVVKRVIPRLRFGLVCTTCWSAWRGRRWCIRFVMGRAWNCRWSIPISRGCLRAARDAQADLNRAVATVFETMAEEVEARQQVRALLTAYLSSAPRDDPLPVAVETRLTAPLIDPASGEDLGVPLLGIVDLVLAEPAGPLVVDFKTSARSGGAQEIQHEVQLTSYSYLIRETAGQLESGLEIRSLVKTKTPKVERQRYERRQEHHFRRLFAVLREYLDALDRGRYSYRPGWSCQACALRDSHCQAWGG